MGIRRVAADGIADVGPHSCLDAFCHERNAGFAEDCIVIPGNKNQVDVVRHSTPTQLRIEKSTGRLTCAPEYRQSPADRFWFIGLQHLGCVIEQPTVINLRCRIGGFGIRDGDLTAAEEKLNSLAIGNEVPE